MHILLQHSKEQIPWHRTDILWSKWISTTIGDICDIFVSIGANIVFLQKLKNHNLFKVKGHIMALMLLSISSVHRIETELYLSPSKQSTSSKQDSCSKCSAEGWVSIGDAWTSCTGGGLRCYRTNRRRKWTWSRSTITGWSRTAETSLNNIWWDLCPQSTDCLSPMSGFWSLQPLQLKGTDPFPSLHRPQVNWPSESPRTHSLQTIHRFHNRF